MIWWAALTMMMLAVVGTQSRGGLLGMVSVAGYLWLRSPRKLLALAPIAVAVLAVLVYAPGAFFERMESIGNYSQDGSAMGRIIAWKAAMRMFADNPVFGVGAGMFPVEFGTEYRPAGYENSPWLTAHSMYFLVLGELGLPGIVTLLVLIVGNIMASSALARPTVGRAGGPAAKGVTSDGRRMLYLLNGSMIGFAIAGAFLSVPYYPHLYILVALMVAARIASTQEELSVEDQKPTGIVMRRRKLRKTTKAVPVGPVGPKRTPGRRKRAIS
jgi:probable O-glycosylation ligase (exosortase A-associated)